MGTGKRSYSQLEESDYASRSPTRRRLNEEEIEEHPKALQRSHHLAFPTSAPRHAPPFQYPNQLLTFSYTPSRLLEFNNSAMRYYTDPPRNADLSYAYDKWIKRPEERGRLDGLLQACLREEVIPERLRTSVVSWRGVMTKILIAPYEEREAWELNVMLLDDILYFEEHVDDQKLKEKENMAPRHRQQSYYGYAFESYCTSATPDPKHDPERLPNGWSGNIDTNVQWCSLVKTKLGDNRLLIGGEVDCVQGKYTGQPDTFVELKTSLVIRGPQDEARFEKLAGPFISIKSFLLGVPEIKVGFRTHSGRLQDLQTFKTLQLPRLVRGKPGAWDPNLCMDWGNSFLTFLKSTIRQWDFRDALRKSESPASSRSPIEATDTARFPEEHIWRVNFVPGKGIEVTLLDEVKSEEVRNGEDRVGFLPQWYWDKVRLHS